MKAWKVQLYWRASPPCVTIPVLLSPCTAARWGWLSVIWWCMRFASINAMLSRQHSHKLYLVPDAPSDHCPQQWVELCVESRRDVRQSVASGCAWCPTFTMVVAQHM